MPLNISKRKKDSLIKKYQNSEKIHVLQYIMKYKRFICVKISLEKRFKKINISGIIEDSIL